MSDINFLLSLQDVIRDRKNNPSESSYTSQLFQKGINKIAQKVGEEAVELVIEAKDDNLHLLHEECADLLYNMIVLLVAKDTSLEAVVEVLEQRRK